MFFSNRGKVYRLKAYEVPEMGRAARGTPIINLIQIEQGEYIEAVIPVKDFDRDRYLFFATRHGIVKKQPWAILPTSAKEGCSPSICVTETN